MFLGHSNNNQLVFETFDLAVAVILMQSHFFIVIEDFNILIEHFKIKLDNINATQSMSRVSRCIDNGPMEGFWGIIKS